MRITRAPRRRRPTRSHRHRQGRNGRVLDRAGDDRGCARRRRGGTGHVLDAGYAVIAGVTQMDDHRDDPGFTLTSCPLNDTPSRHLDVTQWPRHGCLRIATARCEWFDWALLLIKGADQTLADIAKQF